MSNGKTPKEMLSCGGYTLVIRSDKGTLCTKKRGIAPLLGIYEERGELSGALAFDKVVGKAAAFLYVLLNVFSVYAEVMSVSALEVLERYGIDTDFDECVPAIINRDGTGFCPMESTVLSIDDPNEALAAVKEKLKELSSH